jgi:hypothetical protein
MAGLTKDEQGLLETVVGRRVGVRSDGKVLVDAYLTAMARNAYARTVESGPVPTSLVTERSAILIEISRQLGRVIEDFEIEALFRVTPTQARSIRSTLLATYSDDADTLTLTWSMRGVLPPRSGLVRRVLAPAARERAGIGVVLRVASCYRRCYQRPALR